MSSIIPRSSSIPTTSFTEFTMELPMSSIVSLLTIPVIEKKVLQNSWLSNPT